MGADRNDFTVALARGARFSVPAGLLSPAAGMVTNLQNIIQPRI
jgi:hypothetical protein